MWLRPQPARGRCASRWRAEGSVPQSSPGSRRPSSARAKRWLDETGTTETTRNTRKILICRAFQAADGTRTHDLLHGKKNLIRRCTPLCACKLPLFRPEGPRAGYPSIRADSGGFSEPFPNGAPMAGPSAYRAEGPRFDSSTRRRPLGEAMDLERGSWAVLRAYVRPPRRRSGGRPMCDLGLDLSAVALARTSGAPTGRPARSQRADGRSPEREHDTENCESECPSDVREEHDRAGHVPRTARPAAWSYLLGAEWAGRGMRRVRVSAVGQEQ